VRVVVPAGRGAEVTGVTVRLDQINIVVRDMEAMSRFYRRLGLRIESASAEWASHHRSDASVEDGGLVDFDLDSQEFARLWNEGWPGGPGVVLTFRVESRDEVDRLYSDLASAGYRTQQPPYDTFWGARFAVVADPDGNSVGLMSQADPSRATAPPSPPPSEE
jgi:catechol 2,3-dioxygenase-like lactoylglutathione lyase family enzyme